MNRSVLLRRLVLLGAPLPLVAVGLTHPQLDGLIASLAQADVHFALHLALIPLFGLIGLAGRLLTAGVPGRAAAISRGALAVFVTLYAAYATLDGVAVGMLFHSLRELPASQQAATYQFLMATFGGPLGIAAQLVVAIGGTLAWIVGMLAAVVALARAGASREPLILLTLAGLFLVGDHSSYFGSIAFGCFLLAAAWLEFAPRHSAGSQPATA
jgi:hypothetical protein